MVSGLFFDNTKINLTLFSKYEIVIAAPVQRIWRALITPEKVSQWLGCLQFEPSIGHVFYMQPDRDKAISGDIDGATHCELLALEPERLMNFSWYMPDTPKTTVSIVLSPIGDNETRVQLIHSGWDQFPPDDVRQIWEMLSSGWGSHVLPQLKAVTE